MPYYSESDEFHNFCHGLGGLVAAERQSGMLELCQNYAGAMLGSLDLFQKRPGPVEDYQLSPQAHALFLRPTLGV